MTECYRCGQEGHTRSQCPDALPLPPPAQPSRPPAITPRVNRDPAIARTWAQAIREALGWPEDHPPPARGRHAKENP